MDLVKLTAGDKHSWDIFVKAYASVLYSTVYRVLQTNAIEVDPLDADDLAKEIFLKLIRDDYKMLKSYDPKRAGLVSWLTIAARNHTIDFLKRRHMIAEPLTDEALDDFPLNAPSGAFVPDLPEHFLSARQMLVMHMLYDLDVEIKDVARLLDVDEHTVRASKHKALERLRHHFKKEGH